MKQFFYKSTWGYLIAGFLLNPLSSYAAGYLEFDTTGTPYKWDTSAPVQYKLDTSDLGFITKVDPDGAGPLLGADGLVAQALSAWDAVPGATLSFASGGNTSGDITLSNITSFVNFNGNSCPTPDFAVVYDNDGTIFANLFGSSSTSILGLSTPSVLNTGTKKITCGYALLNGDPAVVPDATSSTELQLAYTLMHELGHGRNLEHSQINGSLYLDGGNANDQYIPLMFPIIPGSLTAALSGGIGGIKLDDQFSLLYLYNQSILNSEGRIKGTITNSKGKGVLGANVICYDKNNQYQNAVSWISDAALDGTGDYVCGHLPGGTYQIKIEPVTVAINQWDQGTPPFIPAEYFNGTNESSDPDIDSLTEKTDVTVGATSTVAGINLITNDNGRITSTKKITGTASASNYADLEYFIYVPKSVTKATFDLVGTPSTADLDLFGKCDSPFSLSTNTAGPIYDPAAPSTQQAQFAGTSTAGNEHVVLNAASTPKIDNCEYHLLVINYGASSATFELTATLEGNKPELKANFEPKNALQTNGETLVSTVTFQAQDDQFTIHSLKFTDIGVKSIAGVTTASIYKDANNNGRVDSADTLLTTANVNTTDRTFTLSNLNLFIDEGGEKQLLLTYQLPISASSMPLGFVLIGLLIVAVCGKNRKISLGLTVIFVGLIFGRCSGSSTHDYNPVVQQSTEISAKASGFGDQYTVQVGTPKSVKDFFK